MPIYEYKCNACGKNFETLVMGKTIPECPSCAGKDLSRLMSACGFVSKSSGPSGETTAKSAGSSSCGSCSSSSCSSCGMG